MWPPRGRSDPPIKTISANGGFGTSVITAITAQNTQEVIAAQQIPNDLIKAQFNAIFSDFDISAIKTGMLANASVINSVAECIKKYKCNNNKQRNIFKN